MKKALILLVIIVTGFFNFRVKKRILTMIIIGLDRIMYIIKINYFHLCPIHSIIPQGLRPFWVRTVWYHIYMVSYNSDAPVVYSKESTLGRDNKYCT